MNAVVAMTPKVLSAELARRLGWPHAPTTQTIANWRNRGMPGAQTPEGWLYDPEACERWVRHNAVSAPRGGRRAGSGRKRRTAPPDPVMAAAVEAGRARENARARAALDGLAHVDELLHLTTAELRAVCSLEVEESGLSKAALERLKLIQETRAKHRAEQEALGKLVDAEAVRAEVAASLAGIREAIEQLPARALRAVMSAGQVEAERESAVLDALRREVDGVVGRIGKGEA